MRRVRAVVAAVAVIGVGATASAFYVERPIAIDGMTADWAAVLASPANYVPDLAREQGDPDSPGSSDRDLRAFAATSDGTNLYLYFRRTYSGNNSVTYLAYVDLDHDGDLDGADRILRFDFNGSSPQQRELYVYEPAGPSDPIVGDGQDEPGSMGALLAATMDSASSASGIEVEASISWASLGVAPGSPLRFHASISSGANLPDQVQDNTNPLDSRYARFTLEEGGVGAGAPGAVVRFPHRITHVGNDAERYDLSTLSSLGWTVRLWSDPDGDGDPVDGALLGADENGDGDFSDPLDTYPTGWDATGDGLPDTDLLARGAAPWFLVVEVAIPADAAPGAEDEVTVVARAASDLRVYATNVDLVGAGLVVLTPDRETGAAPGSAAAASLRACNHGSGPDVLDIEWTAVLGWPVQIWTDPDGDGDTSDGALIADSDGDSLLDVGSIAPGACMPIVVRCAVGSGESRGTREELTLVVRSSESPETESASVGVTALAPVVLDPDRVHGALPGEIVLAPHVVVNGGAVEDVLDLAGSSSSGSTVVLWTDPDCDGNPGDGEPVTATDPIEPFGGSACLVTEIRIPPAAPHGSTDVIATTASSRAQPGEGDAASDVVSVVPIRTYANALLTIPSSTFYKCASVWAGAGGLQPGNKYVIFWSDGDPTDGYERVSPQLQADDAGEIDDRYGVLLSDALGPWTIRLETSGGTVVGTYTFTVVGESPAAGVVTYLNTDRLNYAVSGDTLRVRAEIRNESPAYFYRDTVLSYVVFIDADADGIPDAGETFLLADGTTASWAVGLATRVTSPVSVAPFGKYWDSWQVAPASFGQVAVWSVYLRWETSCQALVAHAVMDFSVGCAIAPVASAGPDLLHCSGQSGGIGGPSERRRGYSWSPPMGLSDAGVSNPSASPLSTTTYTLTVTDMDSGCTARDAVEVVVGIAPAPDPTPDLPRVCAGESVVLDAGPGFASYVWSGGETTQTISVSPDATRTYDVTVTDANGCAGSGSETVEVDPLPTPDPTPDAPEICQGTAVTLDAGAGWTSQTWSTGDTARTITVAPSTTTSYSVTVEDGAGCTATASETVGVLPAPLPDVLPDDPAICEGDAIVLDAGTGWTSQTWSNGDTSRFVAVSPTRTTTYDVTVVDANGCTASTSETVVVNPLPAPAITSSASAICEGGSVVLDAGPGWAEVMWSTGETTRTITASPAATTTWVVLVRDANGCIATDSATVTVHALPTFPPQPAVESCAPGLVVVDASSLGCTTYLWATGETTASVATWAGSTSRLGVECWVATGCSSRVEFDLVVHEPPAADAGPDVTTCAMAPVRIGSTGVPGMLYAWSPPDGLDDPTRPDPTATPGAAASYTVTVTDPTTGCATSDEVSVIVRDDTADDMANALRAVEAGADVVHSWADRPGLARYVVRRSLAKTLAGSSLAGEVAAGVERSVDPAVVPDPDSWFYDLAGHVCPITTAR